MSTAIYQCCSFDAARTDDTREYYEETVRDIEQRIGLYADDDDGTSEPYVAARHDVLPVDYFDEGDAGYVPWHLSREVEVPWLNSYLIRTWHATLVRGERISGRVFRATYKIEVD